MTGVFTTGLFAESLTCTLNCTGNAVPTVVICGVPCKIVMLPGGPVRFVKRYDAVSVTPVTPAVTEYGPPAIRFAVNGRAVATPPEFVLTVSMLFWNVPLGPVAGGVN